MQRSTFLRNSLLATAAVSAAPRMLGGRNEQTIIGYNHLPNHKEKTMNAIIHRADSRGSADHGWLKSRHTFSFASYYNPERMHFGVLRVLNDDHVEGGQGFGTHPHKDMEIISIPLSGDLEHKDSMGNAQVIRQGDVQVMSAGTGVHHSEYNKNAHDPVQFLQIWVFPREKHVEPRYDQITLDEQKMENQFLQVLSPNADDEGVWIHQDAWFHLGDFKSGQQAEYQQKKSGNGVYVFMIEGSANVSGNDLNRRDGAGITGTDKLDFSVSEDARILLMEVPMN